MLKSSLNDSVKKTNIINLWLSTSAASLLEGSSSTSWLGRTATLKS